VHLDEQGWAQARRGAEAARSHGYGPLLPSVLVVLGTAALRMGDSTAAEDAFAAVLSATNADSANLLDAYSRALAIAGQTVIARGDTADARRAFEHATALSTAAGTIASVRRQFDLIAAADDRHILTTVRSLLL
jgi:hypothetical protein